MITPVILAAGNSTRMGRPKPYISLGDKTFIETIALRIREAEISGHGVAVFNHQHKSRIDSQSLPDFTPAPNARQELGQLYSLQLALEHVPEKADAILMCLADHPFVKETTYRLLAEKSRSNPDKILIPEYRGEGGHPVVIPRAFFNEVRSLSVKTPGGLKNLFDETPESILRIPVRDPGILSDIDTEEDLKKVIES